MNYEQKYKEVKELIEDCTPDKDGYIHVRPSDIFPELAESKDERIRKGIIQTLERYIKCVEDGHDAPSAKDFLIKDTEKQIAWLEKQGEQKPADKVEPKFKIGDTVTVKPMSCHGKVFKGEPFKIVDIIEDNYVSDDGKTYSISLQDGWELVEPHSSWSEQDESRLAHILRLLDVKDDKKYLLMFGLNSLQDLEKDINWLKSLKNRVQPQSKLESGEKRMLNEVILDLTLLKDKDTGEAGKAAYQKEIDWLKSLKDRYTWKPSDEQMAVLNEVINYAAKSEFQHWNSFIYTLLKSLREQLKKLREE